jgi:hypothetical protein
MPNWCNNYATITCPTKEIYDKLNDAISADKWFEIFAPLQYDNVSNEDGWDNHAAINSWGTKWGPCNIEVNNNDHENYTVDVVFDTAWSPPIGVYRTMNEKFDINTNAFYEECGCDFFGRFCVSKEEEIDDVFDMPSDLAELTELRKIIGSELDDYMLFTWEQLQEEWGEEEEEEEDEDEELHHSNDDKHDNIDS